MEETAKPNPERAKPRWSWKIGFLLSGVLALACAAELIAMFVPTSVATIAAAHPEIEDRSRHPAVGNGCGVNERPSRSGCARILSDVREEEVTFPSTLTGKGRPVLQGTLTLPVDAALGPRPAVVLMHGSGPQSRDESCEHDLVTSHEPLLVFREFAQHLAREGLVVLRYDKRTCSSCYDGEGVDELQFSFRDLVVDARDALHYLETRSEVDPNALLVAGHSEGGNLVAHVASGEPHVIAVLMLAGHIESYADGLRGQNDRLLAARIAQFDYLTALNFWVQDLLGDPLGLVCVDRATEPGANPDEICKGDRLRAWMDYDSMHASTIEVLHQLGRPVFALQGSADINIDPEAISKLRGLLGELPAEYHYVSGVSHCLSNAIDPGDPVRVDPRVLERIDGFLAAVRWQ